MVCGESGLGKSTLVNSLFCADIYSADYPGPSKRTVEKTVQVETTKVVLQVSVHGFQSKLRSILSGVVFMHAIVRCSILDLRIAQWG